VPRRKTVATGHARINVPVGFELVEDAQAKIVASSISS
jgi:hypothetical protein